LHDPGEKSLILMRTREGHEGGSVRVLREMLGGLPDADEVLVKRADWWAAAADRPQWPRDFAGRVRWTDKPVLVHPISGEEYDLQEHGRLEETDPDSIAARSLEHFRRLHEACEGDLRKTLLAFWRFGPELDEDEDNEKLGALWTQLPADSRVPDHSIWEHLDLVSAFAGAFAGDARGEVALLTMTIGPVQPFIAAARSTSDLWAGSHLLSRLAWETMRPLIEALGPDAVLFPRLRGIPQVDLWLIEQGVPSRLFGKASWKGSASADENPLFAAALPNRFVALVPAGRARELAESSTQAVRDWIRAKGREALERLLEAAGEPVDDRLHCFGQLERQLKGFPEVYWASVPFTLIDHSPDGKRVTGTERLARALAPFHGAAAGAPSGFLASPAWQVLQQDISWQDGTNFWTPNPGTLYPALYDLVERVLAATKAVRPFEQVRETGWKDSITGEAEWLTTDPDQLERSYRQQTDTLWARIAEKRPAWARPGEHLGALSMLKRLWPTRFAQEAGKAVGRNFGRFVVSTHTMALAHQLDRWLEHGALTTEGFVEALERIGREDRSIALPPRIVKRYRGQAKALEDARGLLALMEAAQETEDAAEAESLRRVVQDTLKQGVKDEEKAGFRLETYYGLLLMDGDRMGALLAEGGGVRFQECFHKTIREQFEHRAQHNEQLKQYGEMPRPPSPGRHMAISGALNDFALHVVPHIVQREYLGRLLYGGGDDVLAMLPVADLLPAAARLRDAWSGQTRLIGQDDSDSFRRRLKLEKGHALLDGRLLRMMGEKATASAGLVVAHHQAPLARVLRELRAAERGAKDEGDRNALQIRVLKRSGGALQLTLKWSQLATLRKLYAFLREPDVSRRAVYHCLQWLRDLPEPKGDAKMLASLLAYQLRRQAGKKSTADHHDVERLASDIARLAIEQQGPLEWTGNFLSVAEFLARETRASSQFAQRSERDEGEAA
ncbi:MAG: type III-B CRISPR-associated protein Cas10/Cmr2, partial [Gammaproteobacteria bacterium]